MPVQVTKEEIAAWINEAKARLKDSGMPNEFTDKLDSRSYESAVARNIQIMHLLEQITFFLLLKCNEAQRVFDLTETLVRDVDAVDFDPGKKELETLLGRVRSFRENLSQKNLVITFYHAVKRSLRRPMDYEAVLSVREKANIARASLGPVCNSIKKLKDPSLSSEVKEKHLYRLKAFVSNPEFKTLMSNRKVHERYHFFSDQRNIQWLSDLVSTNKQ